MMDTVKNADSWQLESASWMSAKDNLKWVLDTGKQKHTVTHKSLEQPKCLLFNQWLAEMGTDFQNTSKPETGKVIL